MPSLRALLIGQALWELFRYDVLLRVRGFRRIHQSLTQAQSEPAHQDRNLETRITEAVNWAVCLYWKPTLCLQRSVATARLFRKHGVAATVVIGCRPEPFFSHAWVEIGGRVVNDSPAYQQRLSVLERI